MKYLKLLISFTAYTFITAFVLLLSVVAFFFSGKKAFDGLQQIISIWKMLFKYTKTDTGRVSEKYRMKLYGKYKTFRNTEYIYIDFSNFDLGETLLFAYFIFYTSFLTYLVSGTIISFLTVSLIYVNSEVEITNDPVIKETIKYQKYEDDINIDTYCPCIESFKLTEKEVNKSEKTVLLNTDNGNMLLTKNKFLTSELISKATKEVPQGEIQIIKKEDRITFINNGFEFTVNKNQSFVFLYDLSSMFYFNDQYEMFRIAR